MGGETNDVQRASIAAIDESGRVSPLARCVEPGAALTGLVGEWIRETKRDAPLAPVTVVVPSNLVGLSLRRALGRRGLANVSFLTPFRLAGLLAADRLGSAIPITNPVLLAAVRSVLATDPMMFGDAAGHHATHHAVARMFADLSSLTTEQRAAVAETGASGRRAIVLHDRIRRRLGDTFVEADLVDAALASTDLPTDTAGFGPMLWIEPGPVTGPAGRLHHALVAAGIATPLRLLTGDRALDPRGETTTLPTASTVVSVTDADEEARWVTRHLLRLAEDGVALHRTAVFYPTPDPYLALLAAHLTAAGVPFHGPSRHRLADSLTARVLLGALALPDQRWRRDAVMAVVAAGPLRHGDERVQPSAWEDVSRRAGVVNGLLGWQHRLTGFADAEDRAADAGERNATGRRRDATSARALAGFVEHLAQLVDAVRGAATWAERSAEAITMLDQLLGASHRHSAWPEPEQDAFDRVVDALTRLAMLDTIEANPSTTTFLAALRAELDTPAARLGRFGEGVRLGSLSSATGADIEHVIVVGAVEGLLPLGRSESSLLPDAALDACPDSGLGSADRRTAQRRDYLHALASAPPEGRTVLVPRGDLRGGRGTTISRWALESVAALKGEPVVATEWEELAPSGRIDGIAYVSSHERGVLDATTHATTVDRDLVALAASDRPAAHPVAAALPGVARGLAAQVARRSSSFTEWDGNLEGEAIPSTTNAPISPSRLEAWSACGYRYFLANILNLRDRDDPERIVEVSPLDRGSAIHEILERFYLEVIEAGAPAPGTAWTDDQRARLAEIGGEVFDDLERRGRVGRALPWRQMRSELLVTLDEFLTAEEAMRHGFGATPIEMELKFGFDEGRDVGVELPDGRTIKFRGFIDRVDRTSSGELVVADYKTGKGNKFKPLESDDADPTLAGQTLQLGVYAEAAMALLGGDVAESRYWMVDTGANYVARGYSWTDERRARFIEVVDAIVTGIESGVFPAIAGEADTWRGGNQNCTYCDFDRICDRDRGEYQIVKSGDPRLAVRAVLHGDDDEGAV